MHHHQGSQVSRGSLEHLQKDLDGCTFSKVKTLKLLVVISLLFLTNYAQKSVSQQFVCVNFISGLKKGKKNPIKIQHISVNTIIANIVLKNNLVLNLCNANDCKNLIGKIDQGLINLNLSNTSKNKQSVAENKTEKKISC